MSYKNYPMVSRVVYGRGSFNQLNEILAPKRLSTKAPFIFLVDDVFKGKSWLTSRIPLAYDDKLHYISANEEPNTSQVDEIVEQMGSDFDVDKLMIIQRESGESLTDRQLRDQAIFDTMFGIITAEMKCSRTSLWPPRRQLECRKTTPKVNGWMETFILTFPQNK